MAPARGNAFLVAAIALPVVVVAFFLVATAVPRWTVDPPAYDLLLAVDQPSSYMQRSSTTTFEVRDGQVVAIRTPVDEQLYLPVSTLVVIDHATQTLRELAVVPAAGEASSPDEAPASFVVADLAGRAVVAGDTAPDGYRFEARPNRGPGLIGEVFGMSRGGSRFAIVKDGRVVPVDAAGRYVNPRVVGWLTDEGSRQDD